MLLFVNGSDFLKFINLLRNKFIVTFWNRITGTMSICEKLIFICTYYKTSF